ncbi:hypothetical protein OXPF_05180 [Oxobacter pfennigii]|uniref:6-bladed beta-propeller n=1 Tax=Oxobacter pfennigii TaxID=36849 RepID=A0A0P8WDL4_9CLOT|nr:hypothetical protein [Oxobacter pfennigii]KPU46037.1 hypothetical protein OXPF_05180 [Oxobacter pfennigii]
MWNLSFNRILPARLMKEIEEPVLSADNAVFIQNSLNNSKITVYNVITHKTRILNMKNLICFNVHSYDNKIVFEYSGNKRGIGIMDTNTMELDEIELSSSNVILGGIWENNIVLKRGYEIILFDINENKEKSIGNYHHIFGTPVIGYGYCGWLQIFRDKCLIVIYDIKKNNRLVITSRGYINKIIMADGYIVYQSCVNNKHYIYSYNILNGQLIKIYESNKWIELYKGKDNTLVWTVKKDGHETYMFDIHIYDINNMKTIKTLQDYSSLIIPTASKRHLLWIDGKKDRDSVFCMSID